MKFDVAKNEGGPLRKTVSTNANSEAPEAARGKTGKVKIEDADDIKREENISAERYPGLDERLRNIEEHIAVRYGNISVVSHSMISDAFHAVPSPPRSLLDRLKFIEDHLIHLETDYPPWAALHFNQPRRGVCVSLFVYRTNLTINLRTVASSASPDSHYRPLTPDILSSQPIFHYAAH